MLQMQHTNKLVGKMTPLYQYVVTACQRWNVPEMASSRTVCAHCRDYRINNYWPESCKELLAIGQLKYKISGADGRKSQVY